MGREFSVERKNFTSTEFNGETVLDHCMYHVSRISGRDAVPVGTKTSTIEFKDSGFGCFFSNSACIVGYAVPGTPPGLANFVFGLAQDGRDLNLTDPAWHKDTKTFENDTVFMWTLENGYRARVDHFERRDGKRFIGWSVDPPGLAAGDGKAPTAQVEIELLEDTEEADDYDRSAFHYPAVLDQSPPEIYALGSPNAPHLDKPGGFRLPLVYFSWGVLAGSRSLHHHPDNDELLLVLEGKATVRLYGPGRPGESELEGRFEEAYEVSAGDVVLFPQGWVHSVEDKKHRGKPVKVLVVFNNQDFKAIEVNDGVELPNARYEAG